MLSRFVDSFRSPSSPQEPTPRDLIRRRAEIESRLREASEALRRARREAEALGPQVAGARSLADRVQAVEVRLATEIRTLYALGTSSARED